jgi:glutathione S-transferase
MPSKIKITYFDFDGGRGEPARIALSIAGIPFEDDRVPGSAWPARKEQTPFGSMPVLEVDGRRISQSNTINRYVGKLAGLYPEDPWQAALCDELCDAIEDYNLLLGQTMGISDLEALRAAREKLLNGKLPVFLRRFETLLEEHGGGWYVDGRLTIADLKLNDVVRHLQSGKLDFIPKHIVEQVAPKLAAHRARVLAEPRVAAYYARRAAHL